MQSIWSSNSRLHFHSRFAIRFTTYNNKRFFTSSITTAVTDYYDKLIKENKIKDDSNQRIALGHLDKLHADTMIYNEKLKSNTNIDESINKQLKKDETHDESSWSLTSFFGSNEKENNNNNK